VLLLLQDILNQLLKPDSYRIQGVAEFVTFVKEP
jgi:hypothetical protein